MGNEIKSSVKTSIDQSIDSNNARREKLEDLKNEFREKEEAARDLCKQIRRKMSIFLNNCGVTNASHLSEQKRKIFKGMESDYYGARMSVISAGNSFLSTNLSIFNLILDTGKLETQKLLFEHMDH